MDQIRQCVFLSVPGLSGTDRCDQLIRRTFAICMCDDLDVVFVGPVRSVDRLFQRSRGLYEIPGRISIDAGLVGAIPEHRETLR